MISYLDITPELLVTILRGLQKGEEVRCFQVAKNGLPADCKLVKMQSVITGRVIRLYLEHESFTEEQLPAVVLEAFAWPNKNE